MTEHVRDDFWGVRFHIASRRGYEVGPVDRQIERLQRLEEENRVDPLEPWGAPLPTARRAGYDAAEVTTFLDQVVVRWGGEPPERAAAPESSGPFQVRKPWWKRILG